MLSIVLARFGAMGIACGVGAGGSPVPSGVAGPSSFRGDLSRTVSRDGSGGNAVGWTIAASRTVGAGVGGVGGGAGCTDWAKTRTLAVRTDSPALAIECVEILMSTPPR